ncbi:head-tail connector protein [Rhizobium pusense]|uniref:Phage protein DNA packaging protein n=1 Tax=Agrobacterium genomosp. 2 str. CFBP 5494 TaxID=1183436 RepID=A0A9W5EZF8_9HYPH|nr:MULTISPECIES: head-tail connector protein [Rhizobium/Agrobacterium group]MDH0907738.1 head-tail connector protein [Agrobacterium pusense]MDH1094428.1 head-tail connector protein [Agrobacterium pusense]MDH1111647.1 head-tail connector protein [Agrobacterium pusense]MDH2192408.1 head-tail connector protein [Agrobacterium pusense]OJH53439.1 DNA-packaging protein [Agrobacterium pusense]
MIAVSLDLAKAHMQVDNATDDEIITLYIDAAETWAGNYIGKPIADLDPIPADVKLAILKLVAFYYEVRSLATYGFSVDMAPQGVTAILDSYRERWFGDGE